MDSQFNPLKGIKDWHVYFCLILALAGIVSIGYWTIKGIVWLFNHVTIN